MTFTEAAVEVLKREGKPLHFRKIAEIAIRETLLDHVGKIPEETMAGQLAAHCRLPRPDRRIVVVQPGTFALEEWGLPEDPTGLDQLVEGPPVDDPAYRPRERHPIPARDLSRSAGREGREGREGGRGRRREEGEGAEKRHRFPPPAEVAYEILAGAEHPLSLRELAALGAERTLMPDAFVRDVESLGAALREDNRRREASGRKALFAIDGEAVTLEAQPEPGERPAPGAVARAPAGPDELRRSALAALRRRLRECDGPTVEWLSARLLEKMGLRELKVAKRGREHVVFTGRRRMGLADVRHCVRVIRSGAGAGRRDVTEVRRDLGHYGAQIGVLVTAGDAARDARSEAAAASQMPVLLLAGESLAEAFAEAGVACRLVTIPEADEAYFSQAAESAQREESGRRARREERDRREGRDRREERERPEAGTQAEPDADADVEEGTPSVVVDVSGPARDRAEPSEPEDAEDGDGDDGEEGEEAGPDEPGTTAAEARPEGEAPREPGEGRRRRRRRRRRGGRGRGEKRPEGEGVTREGAPREGAPGEAAPPASSTSGEPSATLPGAVSEPLPALPPPSPPEPGGSGEPG